MDPISILGLVGMILKTTIGAKEFVDTVRRAPDSIKVLSADFRAIEYTLRQFETVLQGFDEPTQVAVSDVVRQPLNDCGDLARRTETFLRPFVKPDGPAGAKVWKSFSFAFRESEAIKLQRDLSASKLNLSIAINSAVLVAGQKVDRDVQRVDRRAHRIQKHLGIATSSVADSDITERNTSVEQWIQETEVVAEEGNVIERQEVIDGYRSTTASSTVPEKVPEVPAGWIARWDKNYLEWYYVNTFTQQSQWSRPTQPAQPSPPPLEIQPPTIPENKGGQYGAYQTYQGLSYPSMFNFGVPATGFGFGVNDPAEDAKIEQMFNEEWRRRGWTTVQETTKKKWLLNALYSLRGLPDDAKRQWLSNQALTVEVLAGSFGRKL